MTLISMVIVVALSAQLEPPAAALKAKAQGRYDNCARLLKQLQAQCVAKKKNLESCDAHVGLQQHCEAADVAIQRIKDEPREGARDLVRQLKANGHFVVLEEKKRAIALLIQHDEQFRELHQKVFPAIVEIKLDELGPTAPIAELHKRIVKRGEAYGLPLVLSGGVGKMQLLGRPSLRKDIMPEPDTPERRIDELQIELYLLDDTRERRFFRVLHLMNVTPSDVAMRSEAILDLIYEQLTGEL